ncbi:OB-fold protein [Aquimarina latercula]|uniref:OB-fold protein n=1 Tax=Aquimarina latercula TaxID=987 RepID=UPI000422D68B|nr:hypothetical protein [Aquimarina latercula]
MKKSKIIIAIVLIAFIGGIFMYNYVFNAKHRNIAEEKASITLSAEALYTNFKKDEALATTNFLDKVVAVKGEITELENNEVVLNSKAQIRLDTTETSRHKVGEIITIKGRCVGYDELLEVVKIDQATVLK